MHSHQHAILYDILIRELEDFAVFLIAPDGRIISWNSGVERFFGYAEEDFIRKNIAEIFTPEDRALGADREELETARREGRAADVRWHLCSDQTRVFVEGVLTAIRDDTGAIVSFAKVARAVRPQHVAGSMLATILEGTNDAIYALDKDGQFVFANTQLARLLGLEVDDIVGRKRRDILPGGGDADLRATDESIMEGTQARLVEEQVQTRERGTRVFLTTKAPWRDAQGRLIGLVAIAKDITPRKAYAEERERLLREVKRLNEELRHQH